LSHDKILIDFLVNLEKSFCLIIININKDPDKSIFDSNRNYLTFSSNEKDYSSFIYKIKSTYNFPIDLITSVNYLYPNSFNFDFKQIQHFLAFTHLGDFPFEIIEKIQGN